MATRLDTTDLVYKILGFKLVEFYNFFYPTIDKQKFVSLMEKKLDHRQFVLVMIGVISFMSLVVPNLFCLQNI
jgi:hypothetical protein